MCLVYNKLYGMKNVCLRYFNVYGPRQRFDAYGNCIPIFAERMLRGQEVVIFGDGKQTRDFVNAADVVQANYRAATTEGVSGVFNLGSGTRIAIDELVSLMADVSGTVPNITSGPARPGDVRDSLASIDAAAAAFGFEPSVELEAGLRTYFDWLRTDPVTAARWEAIPVPRGL
jgi:UDP-glucose 4-epimerase